MLNTDFQVLLSVILDKTGIGKETQEIQKLISKYPVELQSKLKTDNLKKNANEVRNIIKQIASDMNIPISNNQIESVLNSFISKTQALELQVTKTATKIKEMQSTGKILFDFSSAEKSYQSYVKLATATDKLKNDFVQLKSAHDALGSSATDEDLVSNYNKFNAALLTVNNTLKQTKLNASDANVQALQLQKITFENQIKTWLRINSGAGKFKTQMMEIQSAISKTDKIGLDNLKRQFQVVSSEAKAAGALGKNFGDSIKTAASKFAYWTSGTAIIMRTVMAIKNMISNVHEMDDALTNINFTMDVSSAQLEKVGSSSLQMAKDLNSSASNVLGAVKLYANAKETADSILEKAKPAIMISNVTDMSGEDSAKMLQSVMNQFDLTQDDLMNIADTIESVSQNMAYDFSSGIQEISEGISTSGSVAKDAGLSLQEYSSMLGLVIEQTGNAGSQIGNAFKTIFSRITKASSTQGTLEEDISAAETSLRSVGVQVRDAADEFRDLSDIMKDLGNVWDGLSSVEQSNISFNIAGVRQTNIIKSLLNNWEQYESLVEKANNSSGVTLENNEKHAESLTGKLNELSAIWTNIGDNTLSSGFLKGLTDVGITTSSIIEKFGLLKTAIIGIGAYTGFKNMGRRVQVYGFKSLILF